MIRLSLWFGGAAFLLRMHSLSCNRFHKWLNLNTDSQQEHYSNDMMYDLLTKRVPKVVRCPKIPGLRLTCDIIYRHISCVLFIHLMATTIWPSDGCCYPGNVEIYKFVETSHFSIPSMSLVLDLEVMLWFSARTLGT